MKTTSLMLQLHINKNPTAPCVAEGSTCFTVIEKCECKISIATSDKILERTKPTPKKPSSYSKTFSEKYSNSFSTLLNTIVLCMAREDISCRRLLRKLADLWIDYIIFYGFEAKYSQNMFLSEKFNIPISNLNYDKCKVVWVWYQVGGKSSVELNELKRQQIPNCKLSNRKTLIITLM